MTSIPAFRYFSLSGPSGLKKQTVTWNLIRSIFERIENAINSVPARPSTPLPTCKDRIFVLFCLALAIRPSISTLESEIFDLRPKLETPEYRRAERVVVSVKLAVYFS